MAPQFELPGPFRWVFSHGRTYLTGPPPQRFPQEVPHLLSVLQRRCHAEVYIIFGSLHKHFDYLHFTPISVISHGIYVHWELLETFMTANPPDPHRRQDRLLCLSPRLARVVGRAWIKRGDYCVRGCSGVCGALKMMRTESLLSPHSPSPYSPGCRRGSTSIYALFSPVLHCTHSLTMELRTSSRSIPLLIPIWRCWHGRDRCCTAPRHGAIG
jgi:hypothetical protein